MGTLDKALALVPRSGQSHPSPFPHPRFHTPCVLLLAFLLEAMSGLREARYCVLSPPDSMFRVPPQLDRLTAYDTGWYCVVIWALGVLYLEPKEVAVKIMSMSSILRSI